MTVPGVGSIISSAVVAAIGNGAGFQQGRAFGAWLGLVPRQEFRKLLTTDAHFTSRIIARVSARVWRQRRHAARLGAPASAPGPRVNTGPPEPAAKGGPPHH
jgi:transposase